MGMASLMVFFLIWRNILDFFVNIETYIFFKLVFEYSEIDFQLGAPHLLTFTFGFEEFWTLAN